MSKDIKEKYRNEFETKLSGILGNQILIKEIRQSFDSDQRVSVEMDLIMLVEDNKQDDLRQLLGLDGFFSNPAAVVQLRVSGYR